MKRERFLERVRNSLKAETLPSVKPPPLPETPTIEAQRLLRQFVREARAVQAQVHAAIERLLQLLAEQSGREYLCWDDKWLPVAGMQNRLTAAGYERLPREISGEPQARQKALAALAQAGVGITGCSAALADTGSLVLESRRGQGRMASLLPPVHIALLTAAQIYPDMQSFLRAQPQAGARSSNLVFITGPSRSADIEQTLTVGVHGPGALHIVLIESEE